MLRSADGALLLFDELCSGTDAHAEGALGVAVLRHALERTGAVCVATSHSAQVKAFAAGRGDCEVAAVRPGGGGVAYGVMGAAEPMRVVEEMDFPAELVEDAKELMGGGGEGAEDFRALNDGLARVLEAAREEREVLRRVVEKAGGRLRALLDRWEAQEEVATEEEKEEVRVVAVEVERAEAELASRAADLGRGVVVVAAKDLAAGDQCVVLSGVYEGEIGSVAEAGRDGAVVKLAFGGGVEETCVVTEAGVWGREAGGGGRRAGWVKVDKVAAKGTEVNKPAEFKSARARKASKSRAAKKK
jgi:hypothetical protein